MGFLFFVFLTSFFKSRVAGRGCRSVIKCLPSMPEVLGSILSTAKNKSTENSRVIIVSLYLVIRTRHEIWF